MDLSRLNNIITAFIHAGQVFEAYKFLKSHKIFASYFPRSKVLYWIYHDGQEMHFFTGDFKCYSIQAQNSKNDDIDRLDRLHRFYNAQNIYEKDLSKFLKNNIDDPEDLIMLYDMFCSRGFKIYKKLYHVDTPDGEPPAMEYDYADNEYVKSEFDKYMNQLCLGEINEKGK